MTTTTPLSSLRRSVTSLPTEEENFGARNPKDLGDGGASNRGTKVCPVSTSAHHHIHSFQTLLKCPCPDRHCSDRGSHFHNAIRNATEPHDPFADHAHSSHDVNAFKVRDQVFALVSRELETLFPPCCKVHGCSTNFALNIS